jgi:hypothetical protein
MSAVATETPYCSEVKGMTPLGLILFYQRKRPAAIAAGLFMSEKLTANS